MLVEMENRFGTIGLSLDVISKIVGITATGCYGVVGMANKNKADGIVYLLKKDFLDKGVKVKAEEDKLLIELHIIVEYGVNIHAICESIVNRVRYVVQDSTGFTVKDITVFVDSMRCDKLGG